MLDIIWYNNETKADTWKLFQVTQITAYTMYTTKNDNSIQKIRRHI
jgi:hypothetical protein